MPVEAQMGGRGMVPIHL